MVTDAVTYDDLVLSESQLEMTRAMSISRGDKALYCVFGAVLGIDGSIALSGRVGSVAAAKTAFKLFARLTAKSLIWGVGVAYTIYDFSSCMGYI